MQCREWRFVCEARAYFAAKYLQRRLKLLIPGAETVKHGERDLRIKYLLAQRLKCKQLAGLRFELFDAGHMSIGYRYPIAVKYLAERLSP